MALQQVQSAAVVRTITVAGQGSTLTVIYTVPAGRRFRGHMIVPSGSYLTIRNDTGVITVNGTDSKPMPLEVAGGTILSHGTGSTAIYGVEE